MEYTLSTIHREDFSSLRLLSGKNGGNPNLSEQYIQSWYYQNPTKSCSLWKVMVGDKIEGFATTNNFVFDIEHKHVLIAMPQNLLTSLKIRGKGFFEKLYKETEHENREQHKIEYFMVFSNQLSSPIFLNKLGYVKANCPPVLFTLFNLKDVFMKRAYKRIETMASIPLNTLYTLKNAMQKTAEYLQWRYSLYPPEQLHIIEVKEKEQVIGYACMKVEKKKGVPFLVLMDVMTHQKDHIPAIIQHCYRYTSRNFYVGLLLFDIPGLVPKRVLQLTFKDRFNVLVKSISQEATIRFSKTPFNFFFGDLDIV